MSKRSNNRFVTINKDVEQNIFCKQRKCVHHIYSHNYVAHVKQHDEIVSKVNDNISTVDMDTTINIMIAFHFLAPKNSFNKDKVYSRAHDIIISLNDDFNNYSTNPNTMNNSKYKSIINQVFISNPAKQNVYLGKEYLKFLPTKPSNITFSLGEIYFYPIENRLSLSQFNDVKDVEIEHHMIKQYIRRSGALAINPENVLNIWIVDMTDTAILGFSNFPWENIDTYHGIIINRRCFFPEDYNEQNFALFKTFTHEVGHFLGLLHVLNLNSGNGAYIRNNIHADSDQIAEGLTNDIPEKLNVFHDPIDKTINKRLHFDDQYNPLFMNFMAYTYDKYVTMFTQHQIQKMRYMLMTYRQKLNSITNKIKLPIPKYNPDTDTIIGSTSNISDKKPLLIPSRETSINPRITVQKNSSQSQHELSYFQSIPLDQSRQYLKQPIPLDSSHQHLKQSESLLNDLQPNSNMVSRLIPNLSANNLNNNGANCSQEQIIENVKNNMFQDPNMLAAQKASAYENMIKNFHAYNSVDGYAKNYPYDLYTMQEYQKHMSLLQQQQHRQDDVFKYQKDNSLVLPNENSPKDNLYLPKTSYSQTYQTSYPPVYPDERSKSIFTTNQQGGTFIDPQSTFLGTQMNQNQRSRLEQNPIDPNFISRSNIQYPIDLSSVGRSDVQPSFDPNSMRRSNIQPSFDPNLMPRHNLFSMSQHNSHLIPGYDPRMIPRYDPRMIPKYDPRTIPRYDPRAIPRYDPRYIPRMDPRHSQNFDPRFSFQMKSHDVNAASPKENKSNKRVDPQIKHLEEQKKKSNNKFMETEIDEDVVKNLQINQKYSKIGAGKTNRNISGIDINTNSTMVDLIDKNDNAIPPSKIINNFRKENDNTNNRSRISTKQNGKIHKAEKLNKAFTYQAANARSKDTKPVNNRFVNTKTMTRAPTKKFVRNRPLNIG